MFVRRFCYLPQFVVVGCRFDCIHPSIMIGYCKVPCRLAGKELELSSYWEAIVLWALPRQTTSLLQTKIATPLTLYFSRVRFQHSLQSTAHSVLSVIANLMFHYPFSGDTLPPSLVTQVMTVTWLSAHCMTPLMARCMHCASVSNLQWKPLILEEFVTLECLDCHENHAHVLHDIFTFLDSGNLVNKSHAQAVYESLRNTK